MLVGGLGHTWACLTFFVAKGNMYKGRCAHCGVARGHKNFKNRRQGCPIPNDFALGLGTADHLQFRRLDPTNDRLCCKCERKGRDEAAAATRRLSGSITRTFTGRSSIGRVKKVKFSLDDTSGTPKFGSNVEDLNLPGRSKVAVANMSQLVIGLGVEKIGLATKQWVEDLVNGGCPAMVPELVVSVPVKKRGRPELQRCGHDLNLETVKTTDSGARVELRLKCSFCQFVTVRENCAKVEQVNLVSKQLKFESNAVECGDLCWGIGGHDCFAEAAAGNETAMCCLCCEVVPSFESIKCNGDDLKQVLKILLAGGTYTTFTGMMTGVGRVMSESQFYRIQQALCPILEVFLQTQLETIRTEYCQFLEGQSDESGVSEICLSVDCAWCHKGYKSKMGTLMVRSFTHNIPLSVVPLQKSHVVRTRTSELGYGDNRDAFPSNYSGTSGGMEVFGAGVAGKELEKSGLGKFSSLAVGDGDAGAVEMIQATPTFEKMLRAGDPGHAGKNFMRSLRKACGEARKGFAYRIPKFAMRLVKRSEKLFTGHDAATVAVREAWFQTQWRYAFSHYTQRECQSTCPCNQFYGNDAAPDIRDGDLSRSFSDVFHKEDLRAKNKAVRRDVDAVGAEDLFRANLLEELIECEQSGVDLSDELECEGIRDDVRSKTFQIVKEIRMGEEIPVGQDEKLVKMRRVEKVWLDLSVKKDAALWAKIAPVMERYANGVHEILWAVNTCASENSNRRRLVFLPKVSRFVRFG
jgi:hypothetical protein